MSTGRQDNQLNGSTTKYVLDFVTTTYYDEKAPFM